MTPEQEDHLRTLIRESGQRMDTKYRKGQSEHGGDLFDKTALELIEAGIDEAVDQLVYLLTARRVLITKGG